MSGLRLSLEGFALHFFCLLCGIGRTLILTLRPFVEHLRQSRQGFGLRLCLIGLLLLPGLLLCLLFHLFRQGFQDFFDQRLCADTGRDGIAHRRFAQPRPFGRLRAALHQFS